MQNLYADILVKLADAKVKFVVAGGVASLLHGVERLTLDIDMALEMSKENLNRFFIVVRDLNFQPRISVPLEFLLDPLQIKDAVENKNALVFTISDPKQPIKQIDVFLTEENSYSELIHGADYVDIWGRRINIASISKLIEMKRKASRPKDLSDIIELEKIQKS